MSPFNSSLEKSSYGSDNSLGRVYNLSMALFKRSFFDESPFSVFGPDFLFQAALYNACATRDFSLAERLLLLYGRHPQATQQMRLKFERDVTLAKKEFPGDDFFLGASQ